MLHKYWTKMDFYCCFVILLYALKLCVNSVLIDIDVIVDNNCFVRTPNRSWKIPKFYSLEINYITTSYKSIYNVIVVSEA